MASETDGCLGIVIGVVVGATIGIGAVMAERNHAWQKECINRGVAAYDAQTGAWKWTVEPKPKATP